MNVDDESVRSMDEQKTRTFKACYHHCQGRILSAMTRREALLCHHSIFKSCYVWIAICSIVQVSVHPTSSAFFCSFVLWMWWMSGNRFQCCQIWETFVLKEEWIQRILKVWGFPKMLARDESREESKYNCSKKKHLYFFGEIFSFREKLEIIVRDLQ